MYMYAYVIGQVYVHNWMPKQTYIFVTKIIDKIAHRFVF